MNLQWTGIILFFFLQFIKLNSPNDKDMETVISGPVLVQSESQSVRYSRDLSVFLSIRKPPSISNRPTEIRNLIFIHYLLATQIAMMGNITYDQLPSSFVWNCQCCDSSNHSVTLCDSLNSLSSRSSFSPLANLSEESASSPHTYQSSKSPSPMKPPKAFSTPKDTDKPKMKQP